MATVFRVPKVKDFTIMSNHHLKNKEMSLKAKGLLTLMLSLPEDWDYTQEGLSKINDDGVCAISSAINELIKFGYLECNELRNEKGHFKGVEYIIHEQPITPKAEEPKTEKPKAEKPKAENPKSDNPNSENRPQLNTNKSNTEKSNTDLLNTYPINSTEPEENGEPVKPQQPERIGMDKILAYRQLIKQNIEYDILCQKLNGNIGMLNEIVDIITETVCTTREYLTVASEERNAETVKSKLLKLNSEHIEYVIDCMRNNTTDVHDTRKYLLAALFNAPSTIDSYYTLKVNHDMYGGN